MRVRQKVGNLHVVLSGRQSGDLRKPTLCRVRNSWWAVYGEVDLEIARSEFAQLRISMDGAYFLFCAAPQKRKGIDGLAQLCREKLAADPFSGCLFIFRSRRGTTIKTLAFDGQGYWMAQKRLSTGRFKWWPEASGPAKSLEAYEAQLLMAAGDISRVRAAPMWRRVNG